MTSLERFSVKYRVDPATECWVWIAAIHTSGYGIFRLGDECIGSHRAAWILFKGSIPDEMDVLHRCDTPPCVNPEHLFLGTHQDNMDDRTKKGHSIGSPTKLNEDIVRYILLSPKSGNKLAIELGVRPEHIGRIRRRESWEYVRV